MDVGFATLFLLIIVLIALMFYGWYSLRQEIAKKCRSKSCTCPTPEPDLLLFTSGTLSSAQLLALDASPVIVVPAVSGKIIQYVAGMVKMIPGSVLYVDPAVSSILFTTNASDTSASVAFNDEFTDLFASPTILTLNMRQYQSATSNTTSLPLYLAIDSNASPTGGNGTMEYYVYYTLSDPL